MIVNPIVLRRNAARYDNAIRAIGGIASMNLENPDVLKSASDILDREASNLRFHGSKLVVVGLNDYTFTAAVKKASPETAAAEALIKQVRADPKAVLKLDGAQLLVMRLRQSTEADAATLRRVAERFKQATAQFGPPARGERIIVRSDALSKVDSFYALVLVVTLLGMLASLVAFADSGLADLIVYVARLSDAWEACQEAADRKRAECLTAADQQTIVNPAAKAQCGFAWAAQSAQCLLTLKMNLPDGVSLPGFH